MEAKMKKYFYTLVMLLITSYALNAQVREIQQGNNALYDDRPIKKNHPVEKKHGIGAAGSMISSPIGFSYQYRFNERNKIELTGFAYYFESESDNYDGTESDIFANFGLEYQFLIHQTYNFKLYYMLGAGIGLYNDQNDYDYWVETDYMYEDRMKFQSVGTGLAVAYIFRNTTIDLDLGFAYRRTENREYEKGKLLNTRKNNYFGLAIGAGIYYNF
jgi:hypothetical protein